LGWVVDFEKMFEELLVGDDNRVIGKHDRFGMPSGSGGYFFVGWRVVVSALVSRYGVDDAGEFGEGVFDTPKASACKVGGFEVGGFGLVWHVMSFFDETQRGRVDAESSAGGWWAIGEDMAEVS